MWEVYWEGGRFFTEEGIRGGGGNQIGIRPC